MHWKEIIEIVESILTITVSIIAIYGAFIGHKSGFFRSLHHIVKHHYDEVKNKKP